MTYGNQKIAHAAVEARVDRDRILVAMLRARGEGHEHTAEALAGLYEDVAVYANRLLAAGHEVDLPLPGLSTRARHVPHFSLSSS
jgi:hypothetical protein